MEVRKRELVAVALVADMNFTTPAQIRAAAAQLASSCPAVGAWDHRRLIDPIASSSLRPLHLEILRDYDSTGRVSGDVELFTRKAGACLPRP
jgi:hypothetical protein